MVMVVIAAVPRTRPVIAAAGMRGAAFVVDTEDRILAHSLVAGPTSVALGVDAALGTHIVRQAKAADEPVAALELRSCVSAGDFE